MTAARLAAVRAVLDRWERTAQAATAGNWAPGDWHVWAVTPTGNVEVCPMNGYEHAADAAHIATFDPPTVLALVAGLRVWADSIEQRLERHRPSYVYGLDHCDWDQERLPCAEHAAALSDLAALGSAVGIDPEAGS